MLYASDAKSLAHAPPAPPIDRMPQADMKARTAVRRGRWRILPVLAGLLLAPSFTYAQAPDGWRWSTDVSAPGLDAALDVAADTSSQAVYTVGYVEKTSGLVDILLSLLLGSQYGGLDGFIAKYDADGIRQWSFLIGGTADDACTGVCVGPDGKIYVTGHFSGSATFGGGANLTSAGGKDMFVACYAADGTLQWKVRGGGAGDDLATSIAFRSGKLFVAGSSTGTSTIAGAASGTGLDPARRNTFIAAFRASDGAGLWRVDGGNANDSELNSICTDADRVYAIGRFKGTTYRLSTSAGSLGTPLTTPAGRNNNGFVTALQQDGSFAWSAAISDAAGSDGTYRANGIGASATGVFITGSSHNGTTFPGSMTVNAAGSPHDYAYVAQLNKNTGATTWVRTMRSTGGGGSDHMQAGRDLVVDRNGDVCLTGSFRSGIEFPNGTTATGTSDAQVFLAKFSGTGLFKWGLSAPGNQDDLANGIDSDGHGHLAVAGTWNDRILFDTEFNDDGGNNLFLAQLTDINFEVAAYRDPSRWNGFGPLCALDAPVDLTTTYIPEQAGAGIAVQSSSGIATPEGALGLTPGGQAIFDTNGDQLVIDFGNTIPTGEHVLMRWLRTGGGTATAQVEVSSDAVTFTSAGSYQTGQGTYIIAPITVPTPTRYIRIRRVASGATFWVDGVFDDLGTEPGGVWSGAGVSGTTFTPTGLSGAIDLTYTVGTRSSTRSVTVHPPSTAGTITGGGLICPNTSATFTLNGHTGTTIAWDISTNGGGSWSSTTTNASTFPLNNVGQPTQVRATVTSGTCPAATATPVTVTPQDITPPTLSGCPGDITVNAIPGECHAVVNYTLPTVTDDCTTPITAAPVDPAHVSGGTFLVGTTTVVLRAADATGNTSTCSFNVTVTDTEAPLMSGCTDLLVDVQAPNACGAVVNYPAVTATDNCGGPLTPVRMAGPASGSLFPFGTTTIVHQATHGALTSSCSFDVTVVDKAPPSFTLAPGPTLLADANCTATMPDLASLLTGLADCSGLGTIIQTPAVGAMLAGTTSASITVVDALGNDTTVQVTVTVTDQTPPQITCPGPISVTLPVGQCSTQVFIPRPTLSDNCGLVALTDSTGGIGSGSWFVPGTHSVTYFATDGANNQSSCPMSVSVLPPPAVDLAYPSTAYCADAGTVLPSVHQPSGGVFACADASLVLDASSGAIDPAASTPGTYTVTYTFAGPCSAQDTFTLSIAPAPDAGTDGTVTLCSSASPIDLFATLGGTPQTGGAWSGPASTTGTFDPATMPGGTYAYTVNGMAACASRSAFVTVIVAHEADAAFSYPQGTYCATGTDPTPIATEAGGTFSASAGLVIDAATGTIDLDASASGAHTITHAFGGTCPSSDTSTLQIDAPASPNAGDDVHVCGLSALLGASGAGAWSAPPGITVASPTEAASSVSASVGGTYVLTWSVSNGTCSATDDVSVTLDVPVTADAGGDVAFCSLSGALHAIGTGTWSGPDAVTLGNTTDPASSITADAPGTYVLTWTVTNGLCVAQSSINATFAQPPQAGDDGSITLCSDAGPVALFDQLIGAQSGGTWTTSSGAPHNGTYDPAIDAPGVLTYTLPGTAPCPADAATVLVTEMTAADAGTDALLALCGHDAPVDLFTALNGEPATGGSWTGPDGGAFSGPFDPTTSVPGTYTYTVNATAPCMNASATVTVSVMPPPDASWNEPSPVCSASGPLDLDALAATVAGGSWSGPGVNGHAFDPASLEGEQTIVHSVTQDGCTATAEGTITVLASPVADAGNDDATCTLTYALQAAAAPGIGGWSALDGGVFTDPAAAGTSVQVDQPGTYRFIRTVTNGPCSDADTVIITFHMADQPANVDAGPDRVQNIRTSAELTGTADGATTTHWSIIHGTGVFDDAAALATMVHGLAVGPNTIVLSAQAGSCPPRSDTLTIMVNDLFIPTGFSPNGDGVNDTFEVVGVDVFADNTLTVFNRWGQVVYSATAYANQWDGRGDNGQELMDDTYYYVLKLDRASTYNGYLIIKR